MNDTLLDRLKHHPPHSLFSTDALDEGAATVGMGRVSRPRIGTRRAVAWVADERLGRCRAELGLGPDGPISTCSCKAQGCAHVAALALMLGGGAHPLKSESSQARSPKEEERLRRAERARSGLFTVSALGSKGAVLGRYEVSSPSGRSYEVTLRALDAPHNSCTCQDFATNLLSTCKHIESVLAFLGSTRALKRRLELSREKGPTSSYLYLGHEPATEVRLRRAGHDLGEARLARRWFDGDGRPTVKTADAWPEVLAEVGRAGIEVPPEVERWARHTLEDAARLRRIDAAEAEVRRAGTQQPGFAGRLYPFQVEGVAFLAGRGRALLADDMGLGKTAQAIAAMARLFRKGEIARALIVCPASLKHQWAQEIARFIDLPGVGATVVEGSREQRAALLAQERPIVITSYELLRADEREMTRLAPDLLVLDEAQRIKNWRTRTADVVKRVPTRLAYVLTGTPLENRLDDLYSLMQVVDPRVFGPLWRFNQDFTELDERGRVQGYRNLGELRARLKPHLLRRRKEEVLTQLPERLVSRLTVKLDDRQRTIHDDAEATVARLMNVLKRRPLSPVEEQALMRAFQKMRMSCDAACLCDAKDGNRGSPKLDELERLLEEICLQGGHKVVVFSEWEKMQALAAAIAERLGIRFVRLHGGVPSHQRGALIERFRKDPACQIFFSTDAGGVGLNLQTADHLINLDLPWNPAVLAQRIARIHRIGQKNAVNVVLLVAEESIESRMEGTLQAKRGLFEASVGDDTTTETLERAGLARRIATLLTESFAAPTGATEVSSARAEAADSAQAAVHRLGESLERLMRTRDGRLVGVVAEGAAPVPAEVAGSVLLMPAGAATALMAFGDSSPLAGSEILFERPALPQDPEAARRKGQLSAAERKLKGAQALEQAGLGGEALGLVRDALALLCRAAAERDPGEEPLALLAAVHCELVPREAIARAEADAFSRAGELARAFGGAAMAPPPPLVAELLAAASALAGRLGQTLSPGAPIARA